MEATDRNEREFADRNYFMTRSTMENNQQNDCDRKDRESTARMNDQEQDRQELAWTNATTLNYNEK